jgi:hypothetical protein
MIVAEMDMAQELHWIEGQMMELPLLRLLVRVPQLVRDQCRLHRLLEVESFHDGQ